MRVSEVFGPTLQGEGPSTGTPAVFVRTWGCNLDCQWCDTPYTWDTTGKLGVVYERDVESRERTPAEVWRRVQERAGAAQVSLLVITGGEPLLQAREVAELVRLACTAGWDVEVETNGTRPPLDVRGIAYRVSPKLYHAATTKRSLRTELLARYADLEGVAFKFVAQAPRDLHDIDHVVGEAGIDPDQVWVMPEGTTAERITATARELALPVIARGWRLTTRLHVHLWGDERGR